MHYDCMVKGGTIVDGTGEAAFQGSLIIKDGIIAGVLRSEADIAAAAGNMPQNS